MKKTKLPRPEAEDWHLDQEAAPARSKKVKPQDPKELFLLEATRAAGGLLKERWLWHGSLPVFQDYVLPKANRVKSEPVERTNFWNS
jgi:hypothetical protein